MRQFMEQREKTEPLTDDILEQFEKLISVYPFGKKTEELDKYQTLVEEEFQRLKATYLNLKGKIPAQQ